MEAEGSLWVIAEVGIGFAGFTSLIAALGASRSSWEAEDVYRFIVLALASLTCVMLAIVPFVALHYGVAETTIWRVGSWMLVVYHPTIVILDIWRARSFLSQQDRIDRFLGATMVVLLAAVVVANLMNALSSRPEVGAYLASLVLLLYVSCVMFGRLIFVLVQPRDAI